MSNEPAVDELLDLRDALAPLAPSGHELICTPVLDGVRVKRVGNTFIDVVRAPLNWHLRVSRVDAPLVWLRGWYYTGLSDGVYHTALVDATMWDGAPDTEPARWNKSLQTGELRPPCAVCGNPVAEPGVRLRVVCPTCQSAEPFE